MYGKRKENVQKIVALVDERKKKMMPFDSIWDEIDKVKRMLEERVAIKQQMQQLHRAEMRKWQQHRDIIIAQQTDKVFKKNSQ